MEITKELVEQIVKAVVNNIDTQDLKDRYRKDIDGRHSEGSGYSENNGYASSTGDSRGMVPARKGTNPKEVVIGIGPAFQTVIRKTINGLNLDDVLSNIKAGIEEEGMASRVVKIFKSSDVAFIGLDAAKLSGSGIGIGLQSKGTVLIHQKDLYPLSNLELFPQAPLLTLETYRKIGRNAARYAKGEKVSPIEGQNDPMIRASYQVKAALMHIKETEQADRRKPAIEWDTK